MVFFLSGPVQKRTETEQNRTETEQKWNSWLAALFPIDSRINAALEEAGA